MMKSTKMEQQNEHASAGRARREDVRAEIAIADEELEKVVGGVVRARDVFVPSWSSSGN